MSRVLPNAMVVRAFLELELPQERLPKDLDQIIGQGLQKLYGFQHADGSWGWWYDDDSSLYQTAYVIYGLVMTGQAGYPVDPGVLARGVAAMEEMLTQADDPRTRAYALYVLATAGHGDLVAAQELLNAQDQLDYFAQAALALALFQGGDVAGADGLLDDLASAAVETADTAHWPQSDQDGTYNRKAMASTTRATALVLEAFAQIRPASPLLPKAARWLMEERSGGHWRTTQETAYAILALSDYIQVSGELEPDYAYSVSLNGAVLDTGVVTAANALEPLPAIQVPYEGLALGDNVVHMVKDGPGRLYYALTLRSAYLSEGFTAVQPLGSGISVTRWYRSVEESGAGFQVGDLIEVHLQVEAADDAWYVIIDDPLPAGCEALNERLNSTSHADSEENPMRWETYGYNRKDVYDERVTLFVTHLPAGVHEYDYLMRATTPGLFSALPTQVYLMYEPDTWARSASQRLWVSPDQVTPPAWLGGDLDRNCRVTDFDLRQVTVPWGTRAGEPGYHATSDLDGDGDVDVADVVRVAANWDRVCSLELVLPNSWQALSPALRLEPASRQVQAGDRFTVTVLLDEAPPLGETLALNGYQFRLRFDPALARAGGATAHIAHSVHPGYEALGPREDDTSGGITLGAFRYGEGLALGRGSVLALGRGSVLATVPFTALADGQFNLEVSDVQAIQAGPPYQSYMPILVKGATVR